jgi:hypothetical protein
VDLADLELPVLPEGEGAHHDEEVALERLDLGPLTPVADVFDRRVVQAEFLLEHREILLGGVDDVEPYPGRVSGEVLAHERCVEGLRLQDTVTEQVARDHRPGA